MFIMHKGYMDVCFKVVSIEGTTYRGQFYNLGYTGNPWLIHDLYKIYALDININDWVKLSPQQMKTPRTKPGLPQ